jgi:hypothetical protein
MVKSVFSVNIYISFILAATGADAERKHSQGIHRHRQNEAGQDSLPQ